MLLSEGAIADGSIWLLKGAARIHSAMAVVIGLLRKGLEVGGVVFLGAMG